MKARFKKTLGSSVEEQNNNEIPNYDISAKISTNLIGKAD